MKAILFVVSLAVVVLLACNKDKFQTKPTIEVKSVSSKIVPRNSGMNITLKVTDKEGDADSVLYLYKVRLNKIKQVTIRDTVPFTIPIFPKNQSVEFQLNLDYQNHLVSARTARRDPGTGKLESDTLDLKFVVKDAKGNKSDTAFIRNVVVQRDSL